MRCAGKLLRKIGQNIIRRLPYIILYISTTVYGYILHVHRQTFWDACRGIVRQSRKLIGILHQRLCWKESYSEAQVERLWTRKLESNLSASLVLWETYRERMREVDNLKGMLEDETHLKLL